MKLIIDQIEGNIVVCESEDRKMISLPMEIFPDRIREGLTVEYEGEKILILEEETKAREQSVKERFSKMFKPKK